MHIHIHTMPRLSAASPSPACLPACTLGVAWQVGCGNGLLLPFLVACEAPAASYRGIDVSDGMVERAKAAHAGDPSCAGARFEGLSFGEVLEEKDVDDALSYDAIFFNGAIRARLPGPRPPTPLPPPVPPTPSSSMAPSVRATPGLALASHLTCGARSPRRTAAPVDRPPTPLTPPYPSLPPLPPLPPLTPLPPPYPPYRASRRVLPRRRADHRKRRAASLAQAVLAAGDFASQRGRIRPSGAHRQRAWRSGKDASNPLNFWLLALGPCPLLALLGPWLLALAHWPLLAFTPSSSTCTQGLPPAFSEEGPS